MEGNNTQAYVKYNYFDKEEQQKNKTPDPFHPDNLYYDQETGTYYCPMGQAMKNIGQRNRKAASGFLQQSNLYQAKL